jgi:hypothetical protein
MRLRPPQAIDVTGIILRSDLLPLSAPVARIALEMAASAFFEALGHNAVGGGDRYGSPSW